MNYDETITWLTGLEATRGWDLKLERVRAALRALGHPEQAHPSVLIAGTNGKGTTAAMVHAALSRAGHRVGFYSSPHLVHFTERVRIGLDEIPRDEVVSRVERIRAVAPPEETGLTFFEVTTLLAFDAFAAAGVDAAVLEVGLGGRLDATNVVEPAVSAIVSIGYDHQRFLGDTLGEIATEKAGVMRPGRPTVVGAGLPEEARLAIDARAREVGAELVEPDETGPFEGLAERGTHVVRNAAVASAILRELARRDARFQVEADELVAACRRLRWPGRAELVRRSPPVVLDGAHNIEAFDALAQVLPRLVGEGPIRLVFAALRDKPWREIAERLIPRCASVDLVQLTGPRAVGVEELAEPFRDRIPTRTHADAGGLLEALCQADGETPILVVGSLFLVGEVYADLLRREGRSSVYDAAREVAA